MICIVVALILAAGTIGYQFLKKSGSDNSWIEDFGYQRNEIYHLTFHLKGERSCPEIPVTIGNAEYKLGFDTGCGAGLAFTDALEGKIDYQLISRTEQLNRDGSHRGWGKLVSVDALTVFGETYENIETGMSDWKMFSSHQFFGLIGLAYFQSRVITLDYAGHRIAISSKPVDTSKLDPKEYVILPLYKTTTKGQENLPFFEVEYNGAPAIAYLDTGKNYSFVNDPMCDYSMSGKPSGLTDISVKIGPMNLTLKDVARVKDLAQAEGLPYPTMLELNSDQIWKCDFLVTLDLIDQRIIFRKMS